MDRNDTRINDTFRTQMEEFETTVQNTFNVVEGWIDEIDEDIAKLDKKLSDRIKDIKN